MVVLIHAVMRKALSRAERWGLVSRNVATLVEPPRPATRKSQPLTPEQTAQLLTAARRDRLHALCVLAIGAACAWANFWV